jgi:PEP-CTERM motif
MRLVCLLRTSWSMLRNCLAAAAIVFGSCGAFANPASHTYSFDFTNFESGAPVDPVTGTVRVTFDPALSTVGSPVDAIGLTIGGHTYTPSEVAFIFPFGQDTIFIYGLLNGTSVVGGTNDFFIDFNVLTFTGQTLMDYAVAGGLGPFFSSQGVVSELRVIPEPATLALLGVALAGLGFSRRRKSS